MKIKKNRLETLRMIISSQELGSQEELLDALQNEGFKLTQATLSRDLKQLKVAKAATMNGNYIYVLPNVTMYKRVSTPNQVKEMMKVPGFVSITFSGNMGVIKTRPGYAGSIELGDSLFEHDNYEQAEEKYLEAKAKAASIYFNDGKQQALDALEKLYEEWSAVKEEEEKQKKEQEKVSEEQAAKLAADQAAAAELVRQGEEAFSQGDLDGANVFYLIAMEKYAALEDTAQIEFLNMKIAALKEKQEEVAARVEDAKALEELARLLEEQKDYEQAKIHYQYAKAIYLEIGKDNKADEIQGKIDLLDAKAAQEEKEKQKEKEEQEAKEAKEGSGG